MSGLKTACTLSLGSPGNSLASGQTPPLTDVPASIARPGKCTKRELLSLIGVHFFRLTVRQGRILLRRMDLPVHDGGRVVAPCLALRAGLGGWIFSLHGTAARSSPHHLPLAWRCGSLLTPVRWGSAPCTGRAGFPPLGPRLPTVPP